MTLFRILIKAASDEWSEHGTQEGHSAADAISKRYLKSPSKEITDMVAIPERSWKPQKIRTETVVKVLLGEEYEARLEKRSVGEPVVEKQEQA